MRFFVMFVTAVCVLFLNNNGICSGISTKWLFIHCFQIELEFGSVGFVKGGKLENLEKNPRSKGENQQQTQPTCDAGSGNRTRVTVVGGERSHHCAIPAPHIVGLLLPRRGRPFTAEAGSAFYCRGGVGLLLPQAAVVGDPV